MLNDSFVVCLSFLWNAVDHALTHFEEIFEVESFTLFHIWIVIRCLNHQKKIKVLIAFCIIIEFIVSNKSLRNITDKSINLLSLFREGKGIEDHSHHIIYFIILEVEGA